MTAIGVVETVPNCVLGGACIVLYGMISSVGLRTLVENHVDFTKNRNLCIAAVMLVLAIGAGSVFFSHLNDAGFWLVKEYFGMSVGQTLKTWSLMETILSVVGLGCVMLLSLVL